VSEALRDGVRGSLRASGQGFLILAAAAALLALLLVSWLVYMPVAALLVAPVTVAVALALDIPPPAPANSLVAIAGAGALACATVLAVFRILVRRARHRRARAA
jgi:hypothetical protein